jgi:hypothetical protein
MRFILRHEFRNIVLDGYKFYVTSFFNNLRQKLIETYPEHTFDIEVDKDYENFGQGGIYSCMSLSILNPENNKYILLSFFDNYKYHFMTHLGWQPKKMAQFFYCGGFNFFDYFSYVKTGNTNLDLEFPDDIEDVYQQFFYGPYFDCCYDKMTELYDNRENNEKINSLFFRGYLWDFRKEMVENIDREDIVIIDKNYNNQNLLYTEYLDELSNYSCALSLPGGTEICNRDIECFGIGVPVIRPFVQTAYPEPLIPNYHYINCYHYCDYSDGGYPNYVSYEDFKKNLINTWDKVKYNKEYLKFVSKNAREWFIRNSTLDKSLEHTFKKINLEKIK